MGSKPIANPCDGSSARASADRPNPSNSPISPNRSPRSMSATTDSRPSIDRLAMAIRPLTTTYILSGASSSWNSTSPRRRSSVVLASVSCRISPGVRSANKSTSASRSVGLITGNDNDVPTERPDKQAESGHFRARGRAKARPCPERAGAEGAMSGRHGYPPARHGIGMGDRGGGRVWQPLRHTEAVRGPRRGAGGPLGARPGPGRRVLDWSLAVGRDVADGVVAVVAPDRLDTPEPGADTVVAGGATRSASVRAGLAAVPDDADVVVVHDGARPLAGAELFARVVVAVRTPQAFRAAALRRAHAGEPEATDDASLIEAAGGKVVVVEGSPANLKITRPVDLIVAEALLRRGTPP